MNEITIKYFGHSCFYICSKNGLRIITDPYSKIIKYDLPETEADIILQSHQHYDHNGVDRVKGSPKIVLGTPKHDTEYELCFPEKKETITFNGFTCPHDASKGKIKGSNTVFTWKLEHINFCFLGDIGHLLPEDQIKKIGKVDVLFIPVGGLTTINASEAAILTGQFSPMAVFPMHYRTPVIENLNIAENTLDDFLNKIDYKKVLDSDVIVFDAISMPVNTTVFALKISL